MNNSDIIARIAQEFKGELLNTEVKNQRRAILTIKPEAILKIAAYLYKAAGFRFIIASAVHTKKGFEIHYHFSNDPTGLILNLHVVLDPEKPEIESLSNMFNASNWIEREMHELFGINFLNHPNQTKPTPSSEAGGFLSGIAISRCTLR